ncbi:hypothetical protein GCM10009605_13470 [Nocardiopsis composta]
MKPTVAKVRRCAPRSRRWSTVVAHLSPVVRLPEGHEGAPVGAVPWAKERWDARAGARPGAAAEKGDARAVLRSPGRGGGLRGGVRRVRIAAAPMAARGTIRFGAQH